MLMVQGELKALLHYAWFHWIFLFFLAILIPTHVFPCSFDTDIGIKTVRKNARKT